MKFKKGDKVVVCVDEPTFSWGEVKSGEIGVVNTYTSVNQLLIDFPSQKVWRCYEYEIKKYINKDNLEKDLLEVEKLLNIKKGGVKNG